MTYCVRHDHRETTFQSLEGLFDKINDCIRRDVEVEWIDIPARDTSTADKIKEVFKKSKLVLSVQKEYSQVDANEMFLDVLADAMKGCVGTGLIGGLITNFVGDQPAEKAVELTAEETAKAVAAKTGAVKAGAVVVGKVAAWKVMLPIAVVGGLVSGLRGWYKAKKNAPIILRMGVKYAHSKSVLRFFPVPTAAAA